MDFKRILLGVIVVIILYLVYIYVFKDGTSSTLYSGGNAKNAVTIKATKLPGNKASVDFTFSIWVYVNSWQYRYGYQKVIYRRVNSGQTTVSPEVSLGAATNDLSITMSIFDSGKGGIVPGKSWTVNNIPIQKWCNIIVSTNNRAVDTYIDGKLVNTHVLKGVPKMDKEAPIYLTPDGGFSGNTAKFRYYARSLSPREAYQIYKEGPGGSMLSDLLNKYKLKVQFLKDNEEINGFEL